MSEKSQKKKLALLDSGWLMMETRETPMHVGGLNLFSLPKDAPKDYMEQLYRQMIEVKSFCAPFNRKLQSRVPGGLDAAWVDDQNFDIDYHVRPSALPRPGRIRELLALVSRLHAQRLDRSRPLWECYLIEGIVGRRFALYTKMHHSLVDGVASMKLLQSRLARSADEAFIPPWSAQWLDNLPPKEKRAALDKNGILDGMRSFGRGAGQLTQMMRLPQGGNATSIYRAPKTVFNKRVTGARRFAAQSWPLSRIKKAAKAREGTVNDIFLAMCSGAMRAYLLSQDGLPKKPLVAQVPVALRSSDQAEEGGNAITAVQVSLATHIADPFARLAAIQESMQAVKARLGGMKKAEINAFTTLTNLPLSLGQVTGISGRVNPLFNLVISNVPGPRETLYLNGAEMTATYPVSLIWHGYPINITVVSYRDSLEFGIIACRDTLPQVQRILDYFESALAELE